MESNELKFVLKLLGYRNYRVLFSKLDLASKDQICQKLADRGVVNYSYKVMRFRIEPAGKRILKQDSQEVPLTEQQLAVLSACEAKAIVPSDISSKKLPPDERQAVIQDLATKGLIKVEKAQITEVWLTEQGTEFLRDEFSPSGKATITFSLLSHYLNFMRQAMRAGAVVESATHSEPVGLTHKPSDEEILQMIRNLDRELGTENYLPIFHLRQKLQPPLSRDELDQALYRLQRQDRLEIGSLVESVHYTPEQFQAGIPQKSGGPLFFLTVND